VGAHVDQCNIITHDLNLAVFVHRDGFKLGCGLECLYASDGVLCWQPVIHGIQQGREFWRLRLLWLPAWRLQMPKRIWRRLPSLCAQQCRPADKNPSPDLIVAPRWCSSLKLMQWVGTIQQLASTGMAASRPEDDGGLYDGSTAAQTGTAEADTASAV